MKWHAFIAIGAIVAVGGWFAFGPRSEDAVFARDQLMQRDVVVATFTSSWTEGYRFTRVEDEGWVWERMSSRGKPYEDVIVHNGKTTLVRISDTCWVPLKHVRLPFIPGVTVARELDAVDDVHRSGREYRYALPAGDAYVLTEPPGHDVEVVEDLSAVERDRIRVVTSGPDFAFLYGEYQIERADEDVAQRARALIANSKPSSTAAIVMLERVLNAPISGFVTGPYDLVVAGDCPDSAVVLRPAATGGQRPGPRTSVPMIAFDREGDAAITNAREVRISMTAPASEILAVAERRAPVSARVRDGLTVVVEPETGLYIAIQIESCLPQPYFRC